MTGRVHAPVRFIAGFGIGPTFPLTLTAPLDATDKPSEAGAVVGLMPGADYTIAAAGPITLGAVRDLTGAFATSLWVPVALALALLAAIPPHPPERLRPPARFEARAAVPGARSRCSCPARSPAA